MKPQWLARLVLTVCALASAVAPDAHGALLPVAVGPTTCVSAAGNSFAPRFSADGRFLVFLSHANNLVTNDDLAPSLDVFVHDLALGRTVLASVNSSGTGGGDGDCAYASLSANGQFVAFASTAGNLAGPDTNQTWDVFVRDLRAGVTRLVSLNATGSGAGNGPSRAPVLSADGSVMVFESAASDLVATANDRPQVFARDLVANTTRLVSANPAGLGGNGASGSPAITPDGRVVAFVSTATDLVPEATNGMAEVYVRDLAGGVTLWASRAVAGFLPGWVESYRCLDPVLSADGLVVTFKVQVPEVTPVLVFYHALEAGVTTLLTPQGLADTLPALSADGRWVAYESESNVWLWDAQTGSNLLVSVNLAGTGPGNGPSRTPVLAPDGSKVTFLSAATDLVTNAANGQFQLYLRDLAAGTTRLVSANLDGAASADLSGTVPALSPDGGLVAFDSVDGWLVAGDVNQASDVFLWERNDGTTRLVSQADATRPWRTPAQASSIARDIGGLFYPELLSMTAHAVSADGRCVVFSSYDSNLAPGDTNQWPDIFVRDLVTGSMTAVSSEPDGFGAERAFSQAALSADGRYVVFAGLTNVSLARYFSEPAPAAIFWRDLQAPTNVWIAERMSGSARDNYYAMSVSADGQRIAFQSAQGGGQSIWLHDRAAGTNRLVSLRWSGSWSITGYSPLLSPDGRWVLFAEGRGAGANLLARDLNLPDSATNVSQVVSVGPDGVTWLGYSGGAVFSRDSRRVAFVGGSSGGGIYVRDLLAQSTIWVCDACARPSLNSNGTVVVFETAPPVGPRQIVLKDLQTGATNLISLSLAGAGGGNGDSTAPQLSADGRYVVFASLADDLAPHDTNRAGDIFVRDRLLGATLLVTLNRCGTGSGNGHSTRPVLGADGRTVLFLSYASDLVEGDYNHVRDVFALRLPGADTDGDRLDDEWEVASFGDLTHDGAADSDGDGLTDRQEFLAGTDPTHGGSVLGVLRVTRLIGGPTTVLWSAVPGRTYRVQYKDRLDAPAWSEFDGPVTATTTTALFVDESAPAFAQRFYRVRLAP